MSDLKPFIAGLPKAELHIHIEGSFEPELMFAIARRNSIDLPYDSVDSLRSAYAFTALQDFLDIYYQGMSVLKTEADFYDLAIAYFSRAHEQNVIHSELFFDPQGHTSRGVDFTTVVNGLTRAQNDARRDFGMTSQLIMCFLRHLDEIDAESTLDQALDFKEVIVGVGLDSSEVGHPPQKFERVFRRAKNAGFRLVAHAGEEGPPDYVRQAIERLEVERIDHGNRALEDASLVELIVQLAIPLTVCPLSNLRLCVIDDMSQHPITKMLDLGLMATVNSDDPAYFGGYINENYAALADALELTRDQSILLASNSLKASFVDDDLRDVHIRRLNDYVTRMR